MMEPFAIIVPMVKRCYQICLTGTLILPLAFERFFIISCCNVKKKVSFQTIEKDSRQRQNYIRRQNYNTALWLFIYIIKHVKLLTPFTCLYILQNCSVIKVRKVRGFFECGRLTLLLLATEILTLSRVTGEYATCTYNLRFTYFDNDSLQQLQFI